jgi:heptosyltransferase-2
MMAISIKILGFLLARMPASFIEAAASFLGFVFVKVPSRRRRMLVSNLSYAFPEWPEGKIIKAAQESASRMIEMGFFSLAYPFFSFGKRSRTILYSSEAEEKIQELRRSPRSVVFLLPHLSLFETIATSPFFRPQGSRTLGAIYRPNRNQALDGQINRARRSTGMVTFSRKEGLLKAKKHLAEGNWLVILFDQNAGDRGILGLFFDRLISYTNLPSLLCKSSGALPVLAFPRRVGLFKTELELTDISCKSPEDISLRAHEMLESRITNDPDGLPEWLWSHGKWKVQARPESRFKISIKRDHLLDRDNLPRKASFCIRIPNWLGDVIMCLPLIEALRKGRPDARITLIAKAQFIPLLKRFKIADDFMALPTSKGLSYFFDYRKNFHCLAECYLLFTNSLRGDIEAVLSGSPQRFGLVLPGRKRPLLTHCLDIEKIGKGELTCLHQTRLWEKMMARFGLLAKVTTQPYELVGVRRDSHKIGIVAGASNNPEKRWAVPSWIELIHALLGKYPELKFTLYGTHGDLPVSDEIAGNFDSPQIVNMTARTDLSELASEFASCGLVIGNDTGGMHLANAVGTPVVVLFGPTNPISTRPFFDSPQTCIQPKDCPPQGGATIDSLGVDRVYWEVSELITDLNQ